MLLYRTHATGKCEYLKNLKNQNSLLSRAHYFAIEQRGSKTFNYQTFIDTIAEILDLQKDTFITGLYYRNKINYSYPDSLTDALKKVVSQAAKATAAQPGDKEEFPINSDHAIDTITKALENSSIIFRARLNKN